MKFGVLVSRKLIDRGAADPYGRSRSATLERSLTL